MKQQVKDALIQELGLKNITGVTFAEQGKKVMLIIDKEYLSNTNKSILNAINVTYPDIIVSIKDPRKPFDYEADCYDYGFIGIELDTEKIANRVTPLGYFLEFINALQEQDVIRYVNDEHPDTKIINIDVVYNGELINPSYRGNTTDNTTRFELSLDRVNQNIFNYLKKRKQQGGEENPCGNSSVVREI